MNARPSASFQAVCVFGATGLTGTIGVQILTSAGAVSVARTTAGITEFATPSGSGVYSVALTAPATPGNYMVMWDSGGTVSEENSAHEDLHVLTDVTYTPYYADWKDDPNTTTPITEAALDHIEAGIAAISTNIA